MNRWVQLQSIGCLACRRYGFHNQPSDCHHLLSGHKRRGDEFTIPLCPWHHRGVWNDRFQHQKMAEALLGPSLAHASKRFREVFGTDEELLFEANRLIAEYQQRATGWKPEPYEIDENGHLLAPKVPIQPPTRRRVPRKSK